MKKKHSIVFTAILSIAIVTLCILSSTKTSATEPNCRATVGNTTFYCYGATTSVCFTVYDNGYFVCKGTEIVVFKPDDPQ